MTTGSDNFSAMKFLLSGFGYEDKRESHQMQRPPFTHGGARIKPRRQLVEEEEEERGRDEDAEVEGAEETLQCKACSSQIKSTQTDVKCSQCHCALHQSCARGTAKKVLCLDCEFFL